jgi:PAS domain S-box-containing protein
MDGRQDDPSDPALRRQHERWRYALDHAEDGLWDWSAEAGQVMRSARCLAMLGYAPDTVPDTVEAWHALVHPEDRARQEAAIHDHIRGDSAIYSIEYRLRTADGGWRWILDRGRVIERFDDGRPRHVVGTHTDVTAYKDLEQRLLERERLLDEAQRIGKVGSWALDLETNSVWWSAELYRIVGWPADRPAPGWPDQEALFAGDGYARLQHAVTRVLGHGEGFNVEVEMLRPDGERRSVEVVAGLVHDPSGRVQRLIGAVHDVTEERRETEAARWRNKLLDRIAAMGRIGGFDLNLATGDIQWTAENYRVHRMDPATPVSVESLLQRYDEPSRLRLSTALDRLRSGQSQEESAEVEFVTDDERKLVLRLTAITEYHEGTPWRITGLTQDITEEREAGERIEQLAHFDTLTGLPNRFLFRQRAVEAIRVSQRARLSLGLLFVDLDRF